MKIVKQKKELRKKIIKMMKSAEDTKVLFRLAKIAELITEIIKIQLSITI